MEHEGSDEEESCENCKKRYPKSSILKHIGKNKECKTFYGPRFNEMKKLNATETALTQKTELVDQYEQKFV